MQTALRPAAYGPLVALLPPPPHDLQGILARFAPIDLAQMDAVALQDRTDTKFLVGATQLARALGALADQYRVLDVGGARLSAYETLYFDTPDFALYLQHHAGKGNRIKLRSRRYVATDQAFLELKQKTNKDRTLKRRVATASLATAGGPELAGFVAAHAPGLAGELEPKLWNSFSRVTLVSRCRAERVTIDLDLAFRGDGRRAALPGVAVVEVKRHGRDRASAFVQQLHAAGVQPTGFSKYCIGVALLFPQIKHNRFKPKLRIIQQLMGDRRDDS